MVQEAIIVKNAKKSYSKKVQILNGLNLTVPKGCIYGLLGASGCGKTTLLTCIAGIRNLDSGDIWVLGGTPGNKSSGIPGPRVGYMPQEISLIGEFTVNDALYYFGVINGLQNDEIERRKEFLSELLQLPPNDRLLKNMSGGQQRRVSFAAALIHRPELLILDEPTVGLDPILREKIWKHLIQITQEEKVTIIITTHYIDECKDAGKIGLMRNGELLAQSAPQQLLERFQCSSLEDAFLILCQAQNADATANTSTVQVNNKAEDTENNILCQNNYERTEDKTLECEENSRYRVSKWRKFKALMMKNSMQFLRYYSGIAFAILFPIIQVSSFFIAVGRDPKTLSLGIINDEVGNCDYGNNLGNISYDEETFTCHISNISCRFLHDLGNSIATQKYYNNNSKIIDDIIDGTIVGIIYFHQNFSKAIERRLENFAFVNDSDIDASQIQISLDMSDFQIGYWMQKKLFELFLKIYESIMKDCDISSKLIDVPVRFEEPIYGSKDPNYTDFVAPVYIVTLAFFLATTVSTSLIITDRLEGLWNRSLVQGIKTWEILLSHILTQTMIIVIHTIMILFLCLLIWQLDYSGSLFLIILFTFLSGCTGMMYGFTLSVLCQNHMMAHFASAGSFFPLILLGGAMWPLEGMPKALRIISFCLPMTYPGVSLRSIFIKDYSIDEPEVFIGLLVNIGWIALLFIICVIGIQRKTV